MLLREIFDNTSVLRLEFPKESFDLSYASNLFSKSNLYRLYKNGILPVLEVDEDIVYIYFLGMPIVIYDGGFLVTPRYDKSVIASRIHSILNVELEVEESEEVYRLYPDIGVVSKEEVLELPYDVSFREAHFYYALSNGLYSKSKNGRELEFRTVTPYYRKEIELVAYFLDPEVRYSRGRMIRKIYVVKLEVDEDTGLREDIYGEEEVVEIAVGMKDGEEPFIDDFGREIERVEKISREFKYTIIERVAEDRYIYHGKFYKLLSGDLYTVKMRDDPTRRFYEFENKPRVYYAERYPRVFSESMLHVRQG